MRSIAVALVTALLLAGCAGYPRQDLDASDSPVARYDWDPGSGGDAALLEGELRLADGCLYVGDTVAVLPRSEAAWDARSSYLTYGGATYAPGDEVAAGGGFADAGVAVGTGAVIPDGCAIGGSREVFLVQDVSLAPRAG